MQLPRRSALKLALIAAPLAVAACQDANQVALELGAPRPTAPQTRQMQTLRIPIQQEAELLRDATQVLLDLGFAIEESSAELGVLVGSKSRDATEAGEVAAAIALTLVAALFLVAVIPSWDEGQVIRSTLSTRPIRASQETEIRITFERRVTTNQGRSRFEELNQPELYREFFSLLRQSQARGQPA